MKLSIIIAPLVLGLLFTAPASVAQSQSETASVVELGKITPNDSYQLWSAINRALLEYAGAIGGKKLQFDVVEVYADLAFDMTPADVMTQTADFRVVLDMILDQLKLAKSQTYEDPLGRKVTPGVVYVNAGYLLDSTIFALHTTSDRQGKPLGDLYVVPTAADKTPNDVFELVSLATNRLRLILAA